MVPQEDIGCRGIYFLEGRNAQNKYEAAVKYNGDKYSCGWYATVEKAKGAYNVAARVFGLPSHEGADLGETQEEHIKLLNLEVKVRFSSHL